MAIETVKLTKALIHNGELREAGELVTVPETLAEQWAEAGRAVYTIRIKALRDGVVAHRHILVAGQEGIASQFRALDLHRDGAAEIVDPSQLTEPLPDRRPPVKPTPPPDPFNGQPRIKVTVTGDHLMFNSTHFGKGVALDLPEERACQELKSGFVKLATGARLTQAGERYLSALRSSRARAGDIFPTYA
ncbi:hypothetical protein OJF2_24890 [Aquisphaera giovannonii]|uniref:Uncharacterized protein n=1 Tax=Aquisphaera giovannonii TaxID=406548 RepID=A0A5B9VZU6_9BACT|nr:hypothetical protein [Aquisphaera giovannonii]QEH33956.1 hypothetical protein OJF2_24890 [Aquisphaera giovannonii]